MAHDRDRPPPAGAAGDAGAGSGDVGPAGPGALAPLLAAGGVVAFTGAGVSTASGIPDFRSPGGLWTRHDPRDFTFSRYVADADVRRRAWQLRRELAAAAPAPNAAHRALVDLESAGRLDAVVTQNIDGLHHDAGSTRVVELHGTSARAVCIGAAPRAGTPDGCGFTTPMDAALARVAAGEPDPGCPDCGGLLKSATVSFGQNLQPGVLDEAQALVTGADTVLALGSTLRVQPAAALPARAVRAGARLAVVNREPTPLDDLADVVVRGDVAEQLPAAVAAAIGGGAARHAAGRTRHPAPPADAPAAEAR